MDTAAPVIDRFQLERRAGEGGMGTVYRARDRATGEHVALKVLHQGLHADLSRFAREAAILDELRHPGIVRYVSRGAAADGRHYIVLEWLEGEDLAKRLDSRGLTAKESIVLARLAAEALAAAHGQGVVHRDIKPSNLFLVGGEVERLKVLDFGVARIESMPPHITATGTTIGTPGYMSPEQARGDREVGPQTDVFALGCVLFECLTGLRAFKGDYDSAGGARVLVDEPPRLHEVLAPVPPALDELVARMLAKDPAARPRDARAVVDALRTLGELPDVVAIPSMRRAEALTGREQRLVTIVVASTTPGTVPVFDATIDVENAPARDLVDAVRARLGLPEERLALDRLADGSLIATLSDRSAATDQVAHAARLALAVQDLLAGARVAVATGPGMIRGNLPVGEVIDRVTSLFERPADPRGGVAVDDTTAGLLDARFEIESDGRSFVLRGERETLEQARTLLGRAMPCVGRDHELAILAGAYQRCVESPAAVAVLVTASPGSGKSRLRHEFLKAVASQPASAQVLVGAADALSAGSRFGALGRAVRRAAGVLDGETLAVQQRKVRARVGRHLAESDAVRVADFVGEMCGVPFPDTRSPMLRHARDDARVMGDQMRAAWIDWLRAECRARPVLLVLEDLHWGDVSTARFVDDALRELADQPFFVLGLARPEVDQVLPGLWVDRAMQHLRLGPLPRRAAEALVRAALGENASTTTVEVLVERAAGNAFFLEEMIRAAVDGNIDALPSTVLAMVQARIHSFEEGARRVLRAASVFGNSFALAGLRALLGASYSTSDVDGWLRLLVSRELLVQRSRARYAHDSEYTFRHALVREAAYGMLTEEDRMLGHRLAGAWLEKLGETDAALLAGHFEQGGQADRAMGWYRRAAEQALQGNDLKGALDRAERAVACGAEGATLGALRLLQAEACGWRADFAAAVGHAQEALSLAQAGDRMWFQSAAHIVVTSGLLGDMGPVVGLLEPLITTIPPPDALVAYSNAVAHVYIMLGMLGLMEQANAFLARMEAVLAPAEETDLMVGGTLCHARVFASMFRGWDPVENLRIAQLGVSRFLSAGHVRSASQVALLAVHARMELGDLEGAETSGREWLDTLGPLENRLLEAVALQSLGAVLGQQGAFAAAREMLLRAVTSFEAQNNPVLEADTRAHLARVLLAEGDRDAALREARRAVDLLSFPGYLRIHALATLALALAAQGQGPEAVAAARDANALHESYGDSCRGAPLVRLAHAESLTANGDVEGARAAIRTARAALLALAERVPSGAERDAFLRRVRENARTLSLAAEM
jgi:tetratricopeptide (TPR) repeat protein